MRQLNKTKKTRTRGLGHKSEFILAQHHVTAMPASRTTQTFLTTWLNGLEAILKPHLKYVSQQFFHLILQVERSDSKLKRKPTTDANDFESVMKLTLTLRFDAMNDSGSDDSGSESGNDDSDAWSE